MYLIFDTETTGLPRNYDAPVNDLDNWPRLVQLAWQLHNTKGVLLSIGNYIIKPEGFSIPYNAEKIHGISTARALKQGHPLVEVLEKFRRDLSSTKLLVGHNIDFDIKIVTAEFLRANLQDLLIGVPSIDTKDESTEYCALPGGKAGKYKWPTLTELHTKLFGKGFDDAHDAAYDVHATAKCFFGLIAERVIVSFDGQLIENIAYEAPKLDKANFAKDSSQKSGIEQFKTQQPERLIPFSHLHVHSQFSILQSTAAVESILKSARQASMRAVAITDHGNLHAAFNAVAGQGEDLKVIIGCEFYVSERRLKHKFTKQDPDKIFFQVLLAKNQQGYMNLSKLSSVGFIEGYYNQMPRIGKDLIVQHKDHLIATTGGLEGEIPQLILNKGEELAEEAFQWWHNLFGEDFYASLLRHGLEEENRVNQVLLRLAKKYGVKPIATNNVYYMQQADAYTHDVLWCIKEAKQMNMSVGKGRKNRFALPNTEFYFKTTQEMNAIFADIPQALANTNDIVDKCEPIKLKRDVLLPAFPIPETFETQDEYLKYLTYQGATVKYQDVDEKVSKRIDYELEIIKKMKFPGYFLIVQDLIKASRNLGVFVGPGRGSAAGSVVAYCTGITNIDPIKYNLLFERFLNPERISMPDIDIDFDDRGRQKVINYVVERYGKNQVAQIITYGKLAAKISIRDVARSLDLPLPASLALAKKIPDTPGITLKKSFEEVAELNDLKNQKEGLESQVLKVAETVEGSVRGTGTHAAGVIIAPDNLMQYVPVCVAKDAELLVTQFDGKVVEDAGMLKMDFLGLKTLTIIKDTLKLVKKNRGISIDIDLIPLDDTKAFELYCQAKTIGTFQFESEGMRMYLKDLQPTNIEDLIAMNALYRPGPRQFIPNFINRKHGKEKVEYPHKLLEPILNYSYGIMVYQEQIMQAAQILAGYTLGKADLLRRAMGKKEIEKMAKHRKIFIEGAAKKNSIASKQAEEIFDIMEKFAYYGFNRSHSAAYSVVAYQTAYLKANYAAEYMAAVLSNWLGNIDKISSFMDECRAMGIQVLRPDVNESDIRFDVNRQGAIRFGLGAIKGAGEVAVATIIKERQENGTYGDIWDFLDRINLRAVSKKTLESLTYAGALDCFDDLHRAQYLHQEENMNGVERLLKYASSCQTEKLSTQISLFGNNSAAALPKPRMPECKPWPDIDKLRYEREVVGFYISGHPLNPYKLILKNICTPINRIPEHKQKEISVGGMITSVDVRHGKTGAAYARFTVEDYDGAVTMPAFSEIYTRFSPLLEQGTFICVKGKVRERYNQPGQWELFPAKITPLAELNNSFKTVQLQANIADVDTKVIDTLRKIIVQNTGKCTLKFKILDTKQNISLNLFSEKFKVNPLPEVFEKINDIGKFSCKVM